MSPVLILIIVALIGLPSFVRPRGPEEAEKHERRPGVKAWWF